MKATKPIMLAATTAWFAILPCVGTASAADDKSTIGAVGDLLGFSKDEAVDKIDYSERPKLVLPKNTSDLPTPSERKNRPADWPTDAPGHGRNADRFSRVPGAPDEKPKPSLIEKIRGPRTKPASGSYDDTSIFVKTISRLRTPKEAEPDEPTRRMLSDPPDGYRRPTQPLSTVRDSGEKTGFFRIFDESSNIANTVSTESAGKPAPQAASNNSGASQKPESSTTQAFDSFVSGIFKKQE